MSGESGDNELIIALILSFFITGLGQIFQGRTKEGAVLLVGAILYGGISFVITLLTGGLAGLILGPLGLLYWAFGLYDTYARVLNL
jgi:TM2 domain-containing membrane protein YozV